MRKVIGRTEDFRPPVKKILRGALRRVKRWLSEEPRGATQLPPFDNSLEWIRPAFRQLEPVCPRPNYIWGTLQGVALAKVLGHRRVSVIEFGVAGGAGLLALEQAAAHVERLTGVGVDVFGFDTGSGLPPPTDYRDLPFMWDEGYFAMDVPQLKARLQRAQLQLGRVEDTVRDFLASSFAPLAFVAFDLDFYTGTQHALRVFAVNSDRLLPRTPCYFDDILGFGYSEYTGERLAINEFNAAHAQRKVCPQHGLKFYVPPAHLNAGWVEMMFYLHIFDHPQYNTLAHVGGSHHLDISGQWVQRPAVKA